MKATKLFIMGCSMAFFASCGGAETSEGDASAEEKKLDGAALGAEYCKCLETKDAIDCAGMAIDHTVTLTADAEQLQAYEAAIAPCSEAAEAAAMEKMEEDLDAAMEELEESIDDEMSEEETME